MIIHKTNFRKLAVLSVIFLSFLTYITIRAYTLSFTHDESLTYTIVEGDKTWTGTANHHPLNTFLMYICHVLFGNNEFALRLPNVFSFLFYFIGCLCIFSSSKNALAFVLGISLALFNPYLIEFFSLARGYGLSQGFIMVSLYFLIRNGYDYTSYSSLIKDFLFSVIFASFAVFANFSMVNLLICILILFGIKFYAFRKKQLDKVRYDHFVFITVLGLASLYFGIERLILLKKSGQLYHGEDNIIKSIHSLIKPSICLIENPPVWIISGISILIICSLIVGLIVLVVKKNYYSSFSMTVMLTIMLLFGLLLENILFGAKYPAQRTALLYVPVITVFLYHFSLYLIEYYRLNKAIYIPTIMCIMVLLAVNFFVGANITHTKEWHYDAHTKEVMRIIHEKTKNSHKKASVSNDWLFEPTMNYYIKRWNVNVTPANRNGIRLDADFIYLLDDKNKPIGFKTLRYFPDTKSELLMKN